MDARNFDLQSLRARMHGIGERLEGPWSEALGEHLHLDRGSKECAYWHSGYHQALVDVLRMIAERSASGDISDTSSRRLAAG